MSTLTTLLALLVLQSGPSDASPAAGVPAPVQEAGQQEVSEDPSQPGTLPRAVVAELIRQAMGEPEDEAAWRGLAQALPTLSEGGFDPGLDRAASLADSMAVLAESGSAQVEAGDGLEPDTTGEAPTEASLLVAVDSDPLDPGAGPDASRPEARPTGSSTTGLTGAESRSARALAASWAARAERLIDGAPGALRPAADAARAKAEALPQGSLPAAGALTLLGGLLIGVRRTRTRRARRAEPVLAEDARAVETPGAADPRLWTVRSLAASGLPLTEIARKTGLAQDALTFMLSPSARQDDGATPVSGSPAQTSQVPSASLPGPPSAASRFRDGRLTY